MKTGHLITISIIASYLIISFHLWNLDPSSWTRDQRGNMFFLSCIPVIINAVIRVTK